MSNQRFEKQRQFLRNRLSPEGYAGLHLTIGVLVVLLASWWFAAIAEDLSPDHPLVLFDQRVAVWFHQHATTTLTHVAKAITFFGSVLGLTILSVAVALVFIVRRAWFNLFLFAVTMTGESLLNVLLKDLFHRHRPVLENPLVTLTSYGFPSGHTMGVTVFFRLARVIPRENREHCRGSARLFHRGGARYPADRFNASLPWRTFS
jgi:undecaprenyl-diphosphatase